MNFTDNELIAEFMGLEKCDPDLTYNLEHWRVASDDHTLRTAFVAYGHQLKYHTSWDWLMPVVQKIDRMFVGSVDNEDLQDISHQVMCVTRHDISTSIHTIYRDVVEFIKWYNSQTPHP